MTFPTPHPPPPFLFILLFSGDFLPSDGLSWCPRETQEQRDRGGKRAHDEIGKAYWRRKLRETDRLRYAVIFEEEERLRAKKRVTGEIAHAADTDDSAGNPIGAF